MPFSDPQTRQLTLVTTFKQDVDLLMSRSYKLGFKAGLVLGLFIGPLVTTLFFYVCTLLKR